VALAVWFTLNFSHWSTKHGAGVSPVCEGKVVVEGLGELEAEALKAVRLQGHCNRHVNACQMAAVCKVDRSECQC